MLTYRYFIDVIYAYSLIYCWWMNEEVLLFRQQRVSPPSPFSINCHTAVCVCVYRQPTLTSRSQGCNTLNRFTMLQIITMATWFERGTEDRMAQTSAMQLNLSNEVISTSPLTCASVLCSIPV